MGCVLGSGGVDLFEASRVMDLFLLLVEVFLEEEALLDLFCEF